MPKSGKSWACGRVADLQHISAIFILEHQHIDFSTVDRLHLNILLTAKERD
jgi:hypothetical protein